MKLESEAVLVLVVAGLQTGASAPQPTLPPGTSAEQSFVVAGLQTGASAPQDQPESPKLGEKLLETKENCYSQNG
jgi:hypothetical protein